MDKGIDYGMGQTNVDLDTGIRYGVIHQHEVLQAWADESDPVYPECEDHGDDCPDDCDSLEMADPIAFTYDSEGYLCEAGDQGDIFVMKSPYFTRAQYCSPCAPGACYLTNPIESGDRAYCFGPDWFEDGSPYPIYSVETGKLVHPMREE